MLGTSATGATSYYTRPFAAERISINDLKGERIIPIETTISSQPFTRV